MTLPPQSKPHDVSVVVVGEKMLRWTHFDSESNTCTTTGKRTYGVNEDATECLLSWIHQEDIDTQQKVLIALADLPLTLIPSSLYDEDHEEHHVALNHALEDGHSRYRQELPHLDAVAIGVTSTQLLATITEKLPQAQLSLQGANLIEAFLLDQGAQTTNKIYAYLGADSLECFVYKGKKLLLHNQNKVTHPNDVLYFVQLTIDEMNWTEIDRVIMWGELEKQMLSELSKYYKVEEFYGLKYQKLADGVEQSSKINYSDLFSLYQCG